MISEHSTVLDKILRNTEWCLNKEFEVCVFVMFDLMSALQLGLITRHKPSEGQIQSQQIALSVKIKPQDVM